MTDNSNIPQLVIVSVQQQGVPQNLAITFVEVFLMDSLSFEAVLHLAWLQVRLQTSFHMK